jgi:hypothetical protein
MNIHIHWNGERVAAASCYTSLVSLLARNTIFRTTQFVKPRINLFKMSFITRILDT